VGRWQLGEDREIRARDLGDLAGEIAAYEAV